MILVKYCVKILSSRSHACKNVPLLVVAASIEIHKASAVGKEILLFVSSTVYT